MNKYNQGYLLLVAALISGSTLAFMVMESMNERQAASWASVPASPGLIQASAVLPDFFRP
jgi:hypothetical protein